MHHTQKNILIINGHPDSESFNWALSEAYKKGAEASGAHVEVLNIGELQFDSNLRFGYRQRMELEPDLLAAQDKIRAANHIVWVFPSWWASMPAVMKGFIDRIFLPGFAFKYHEGKPFPQQLLKGKSARLIVTMDAPGWYYRYVYGQPGLNIMKRVTLGFAGIHPIRVTQLTKVKFSTPEKRAKWLAAVEKLGRALR